MKSLLFNLNKSDIFVDPFPHIVITDPIEPEVCSKLISEFPHMETVTQGAPTLSNQRFSYSANNSLNGNVSPLWKEFVRTHTSQAFWDEFLLLFKDEIREIYPDLEKKIGQLETLKARTRNIDDFSSSDVLLDAQICINTPVKASPSSVRRCHVDLPNKLFAGLYYLRDPRDTSTGGDLEIYRFRDKVYGFKGEYVDNKYIELVKTVKYERNVFILFINSSKSLHAVTVRSITDFPRLFFNLVGEVNCSLFNLEEFQEKDSFPDKLISDSKGVLRNLKKVIPFVSR